MNVASLSLVALLVVGVPYYVATMLLGRKSRFKNTLSVGIYAMMAVTGIFILRDAFRLANLQGYPAENAVWSGFAGFGLVIYGVDQVVMTFRALRRQRDKAHT